MYHIIPGVITSYIFQEEALVEYEIKELAIAVANEQKVNDFDMETTFKAGDILLVEGEDITVDAATQTYGWRIEILTGVKLLPFNLFFYIIIINSNLCF